MLILGVYGHFLDKNLRIKHPLLGLKFISGPYTSSAIADIILRLMGEYGIRERWGVLMADNADNNDTAYKKMVSELYPNEGDGARRARYYRYIVNLTTKAVTARHTVGKESAPKMYGLRIIEETKLERGKERKREFLLAARVVEIVRYAKPKVSS